jgi:hypothetical protein
VHCQICILVPRRCLPKSGDLETEDDEWPEHDVDVGGDPHVDDEWRVECPDKYIWNCCDRNGVEEGCVKGQHRSTGAKEEHAKLRCFGFKH